MKVTVKESRVRNLIPFYSLQLLSPTSTQICTDCFVELKVTTSKGSKEKDKDKDKEQKKCCPFCEKDAFLVSFSLSSASGPLTKETIDSADVDKSNCNDASTAVTSRTNSLSSSSGSWLTPEQERKIRSCSMDDSMVRTTESGA